MSFGFSIGDFIALIELGNKIKQRFEEAPKQYQAILHEVDTVLNVLDRIKRSIEENGLSDATTKDIKAVLKPCDDVLSDIQQLLSKNESLSDSSSNRRKRFWTRLNWDARKISEFRDRLSICLVAMDAVLQEATRSDLSKLAYQRDEQQILDWLASDEYISQHTNSWKQRLPGTGQWLIDSQPFEAWKSVPGMLLLHGIPGTGKTVLSSIIIESLTNSKDHKICYYYCDYKRQSDQTPSEILGCLLRQLVQGKIPSYVIDFYQKHNSSTPNVQDLRQLLTRVAAKSKIFLVLDALDELLLENRRNMTTELLALKSAGMNILVTSRSLPDVMSALKCQLLEIRASPDDIAQYIEGKVIGLPKFVLEKGLVDEIKRAVTAAADGIFLLVRLHVEALKGKRSVHALRKQLQTLATGISGYASAYVEIMKRITGQVDDQRELAIDALTWVVHAERALRKEELLHALSIEDGEFHQDALPDVDDVLDACCGLLTVEKDTRVVRLIHETTLEFLKQGKDWLPNPHSKMSQACSNYLKSEKLVQSLHSDDVLVEFPFHDYASQYWLHHLQEKEQPINVLDVRNLELVENASQALLGKMSKKYLELFQRHPDKRGIHLLVHGDLCDLIANFAEVYDINGFDQHGITPLCRAIEKASLEVVQVLIANGADVNYQDVNGDTPLMHAVRLDKASLDVMQVLIANGADVNYQCVNRETPLIHTACLDKASAINLLLQKGACLERQNADGKTALWLAIEHKATKAVDILLKHGARVDAEDLQGHVLTNSCFEHCLRINPGCQQSCSAKYCVIDFLFEDNIRGNKYCRVSESTLVYLLKVLLEEGLSVDHRKSSRTLLCYAISCGQREAAKFLIGYGADVAPENVLIAPVEYTIVTGDLEMFSLLLENGAVEQYEGEEARELLYNPWVIEKSGFLVLLLKHWCSMDATRGCQGEGIGSSTDHRDGRKCIRNPLNLHNVAIILMKACRNGWVEVVQLLIENYPNKAGLLTSKEWGHMVSYARDQPEMLAYLRKCKADHEVLFGHSIPGSLVGQIVL